MRNVGKKRTRNVLDITTVPTSNRSTAIGRLPLQAQSQLGLLDDSCRSAGSKQIMRNLHFTDNTDPRSKTDRAWKVRSVVDCLQATFKRGFTTPPVLSFDEGVLPSRSRYNPTRQYLKDKPHKWGTKLFVTCCASTAYCLRYILAKFYMLDLTTCCFTC